MNDLGATISKRLLHWSAETISGTSFRLDKVATKTSMNGLSLQENKHKQELLDVSNVHERMKFKILILA